MTANLACHIGITADIWWNLPTKYIVYYLQNKVITPQNLWLYGYKGDDPKKYCEHTVITCIYLGDSSLRWPQCLRHQVERDQSLRGFHLHRQTADLRHWGMAPTSSMLHIGRFCTVTHLLHGAGIWIPTFTPNMAQTWVNIIHSIPYVDIWVTVCVKRCHELF